MLPTLATKVDALQKDLVEVRSLCREIIPAPEALAENAAEAERVAHTAHQKKLDRAGGLLSDACDKVTKELLDNLTRAGNTSIGVQNLLSNTHSIQQTELAPDFVAPTALKKYVKVTTQYRGALQVADPGIAGNISTFGEQIAFHAAKEAAKSAATAPVKPKQPKQPKQQPKKQPVKRPAAEDSDESKAKKTKV